MGHVRAGAGLEHYTRRAQVRSVRDVGPDYAITLRAWRAAWEAEKAAVLQLGYSERFWRKYRRAALDLS